MAPASLSAAHSMGAAWPFERTNTSWSRPEGSRGSKRISSKKSTDTISAQDMHVVGCPEAASDVISREWRRSFWAIRASGLSSTVMSFTRLKGRGQGGRAENRSVWQSRGDGDRRRSSERGSCPIWLVDDPLLDLFPERDGFASHLYPRSGGSIAWSGGRSVPAQARLLVQSPGDDDQKRSAGPS